MDERQVSWVAIVLGGLLVGLLILGGLVLLFRWWTNAAAPPPFAPSAPEVEGFESNGATIYHTGFSEEGERVPFSGGPHWLYRRGGGCAACHGPEGEGEEFIMMSNEEAPNIQYEHLTEETEHGEGEEHPPYNEALLKRAITEGLDPAGEPLDRTMPRWELEEDDLEDLIAFLKTLGHEEAH
ncbi:MAG: c-type cytochrome [Anaerolineales bacterium]